MLYFTKFTALAALAAYADAACQTREETTTEDDGEGGTIDVTTTLFDCEDFNQKDQVEAAITKYASDYTWSMWETDAGSAGYKVKMFRFVGDSEDMSIKNDEDEDI